LAEIVEARSRLSRQSPLPSDLDGAVTAFVRQGRAFVDAETPLSADNTELRRFVDAASDRMPAGFDRLIARFEADATAAAATARWVAYGSAAALGVGLLIVGLFLLRPMAVQATRRFNRLTAAASSLEMGLATTAAHERERVAFILRLEQALGGQIKTVIGLADVLALGAAGPLTDKQREYLTRIVDSGRNLASTLEDVRQLALVDAGQLAVDSGPVDLGEAVAETLRLARGQADRSDIKLIQSLPVDAPALHTDSALLRQMLQRLLSNAIRFSHAGGQVHVRVGRDPRGGTAIAIEDQGIGMRREEIARALLGLGRVDSVAAAGQGRPEGGGLGLPLVKALIERQGGALDLSSVPGKGTTATLRFPPNPSPSA
jgi:signal transduction histidine kinase